MKQKVYPVVIVDDSEVDRFLLRLAIRDGAPQMRVVHELESGEDLIAYVAGEGRYADRERHPLPELVFLDSRMPRKGGIEVLQWLRTKPEIPFKVAMLADSSGTTLRATALELGAHYFISKIANGDEMVREMRKLISDLDKGQGAGSEQP